MFSNCGIQIHIQDRKSFNGHYLSEFLGCNAIALQLQDTLKPQEYHYQRISYCARKIFHVVQILRLVIKWNDPVIKVRNFSSIERWWTDSDKEFRRNLYIRLFGEKNVNFS